MQSTFPRPDAHELVRQYARSRHRIIDLLGDISEDSSSLPVQACPAWNVQQLVSHIVGLATEVSAGNPPGDDSQAWVDEIVAARSSMSVRDLIDEWNTSGPAFEALATTTPRLAFPLSYDLVVHEHDLRHALATPGARDDESVLVSMYVGALLLDGDLKKNSAGSVRLRVGEHEWICGEGSEVLALELEANPKWPHPTWELLRLTGSRRSAAQLSRYPWQGSLSEVATSMFHMDLPSQDIDEQP